MKHGKNGPANGIIRPRCIGYNLLVDIVIVDNGRRKELVRVIPRRNRTVHRDGTGIGSMSRPRDNRESAE